MTKAQRKEFMFEKIKSALRAIQNSPKYDWSRSGEPIFEAAEKLWIKVNEYVDGKADEDAVKELYRKYVGLYAK